MCSTPTAYNPTANMISPALAENFQLKNGDIVELRFRGRELCIPIWIAPGHAENCVPKLRRPVAIEFPQDRTPGPYRESVQELQRGDLLGLVSAL